MYYVYQKFRKKERPPDAPFRTFAAGETPPLPELERKVCTRLVRLEEVQPFGRFACGTGRGGLALLRNSTVANTSSVSPMFTRSCTLNSPFR